MHRARWPSADRVATAPVILNKIPVRSGAGCGTITPRQFADAPGAASRFVPAPGLPSLIPLAFRHTAIFVQSPSLITLVTTYIIMIAISGADLRPPRPYPGLISTTGRTRRPDTSGSRRKPPRQNGTIGKNVQFLFW
ncbi:hypothetical protein FJL53_22230 [Salmonella enterica subsp. enterica]|nr:hypothetical protein [Salmonella enterica subsp. enterica serovar Muenchen]